MNDTNSTPNGQAWTEPITNMEFIHVPSGSYQMGDVIGDRFLDDWPVHKVTLNGFWIGKYNVTQNQWVKIMGENPADRGNSPNNIGGNKPVFCISWLETQEFIRKLNSLGQTKFRLPTEAEWEYAARSCGITQKYSGGDNIDEVAWYQGNSEGELHPVGLKQPNEIGICDMTGNINEWCEDWYDKEAYSKLQQHNPVCLNSSSGRRVTRGGCYDNNDWFTRVSHREHDIPHVPRFYVGLRLAITY